MTSLRKEKAPRWLWEYYHNMISHNIAKLCYQDRLNMLSVHRFFISCSPDQRFPLKYVRVIQYPMVHQYRKWLNVQFFFSIGFYCSTRRLINTFLCLNIFLLSKPFYLCSYLSGHPDSWPRVQGSWSITEMNLWKINTLVMRQRGGTKTLWSLCSCIYLSALVCQRCSGSVECQ